MRILSGVFEGVTTGTPIAMMIDNVDQRSRDYSAIAAQFRPGHADLTYELKYGMRDYRGGGRSSARETAMRVAAGGVARKRAGRAACASAARWCRSARTGSTATRWDWDAGGATTRSSAPTRSWRRSGRTTWRRCARPAPPPAR